VEVVFIIAKNREIQFSYTLASPRVSSPLHITENLGEIGIPVFE